jgi:hypothetical protein
MMMTVSDENMDDLNMDALDALLSDVSNGPALQPNEGFMARVLEDALAQQPMPSVAPLNASTVTV